MINNSNFQEAKNGFKELTEKKLQFQIFRHFNSEDPTSLKIIKWLNLHRKEKNKRR